MRATAGLILAAVAATCAGPGAGPGDPPRDDWVATWTAAPQLTEPRNMPPAPYLAGNTLRQAVRVSIGGDQLRVHLSNQYGTSPLEVRSARLARYAGAGRTVPGTDRALSFRGRDGVTIAAGWVASSDPLDFPLEPLADVAVTMTFGAVPTELTGHPGSRTTSYLAPGTLLEGPSADGAAATDHWYVLTGIDVVAPRAAAVVVLGNSITDGRGSTTNGNDRWTDVLAERLRARTGTAPVAVLNAGIGGNCVLKGCLGPPGTARYERDVLDPPGVRWVVIFEGINDIGGASGASEADSVAGALIQAYEAMIRRGHDRGLRVYGATLLPFAGSDYSTPAREAARRRVNRWIRTGEAFDAVVDFESALADPADPARLRPDADTGDHLHPSASGHRRLGEAVDLSLFDPGY